MKAVAFKLVLRSWWRNKTFSIISIISLAIGIACTNMLAAFVIHEYNLEADNPNRSHIYMMDQDSPLQPGERVCFTVGSISVEIKEKYPEVIDYLRLNNIGMDYIKVDNNHFDPITIVTTDSSFPRFFPYKVVTGDLNEALTQPNKIALTEACAQKYFGSKNPIGQIITTGQNSTTTVHKEDGTIASFTPAKEGVPEKVCKQLITDITKDYRAIKAPVVPFIKATQDRVTLEIQRGCIRGCRFCQAGMIYRPTRERNVERLKQYAKAMLESTGHEEISLSSLSSSDYSELEELVNFLIDEFKGKGVNISLPSLRIDAFSLDVMSKVQDIKKSSLTFAPEAGSQRMRNVINKGLTEEVILDGAGKAFEGGWNKVKLYFMLGLPTETEDDIKGIAHLAEKIAERYYEIPKDQRNGKCQITASSSFFIPKPFTPFQWAPMNTEREFLDKAAIVKAEVRAQLNQKSIRYIYHEADISLLEGFLARGDRKCAEVIEKAYRKGAIFDAWSEYFRKDAWEEAFAETGIDVSFYACRKRSTDEILPWDFLDIGVTKKFLIREWERAQKETVTPNCKMQCSGCGAKSFGGGVCYENQN